MKIAIATLSVVSLMATNPVGAQIFDRGIDQLSKKCGGDPSLFNAKEISASQSLHFLTIPDTKPNIVRNFIEGFTINGGCLPSISSVASGFILHNGQVIDRRHHPFKLLKSSEHITLEQSAPQLPPSPSLTKVDFYFDNTQISLRFTEALYLDGKSYIGLWSDSHHSAISVIKCDAEMKCNVSPPALLSPKHIKQIGFVGDPHGGNSGNLTLWMNIGKDRDAVIAFDARFP